MSHARAATGKTSNTVRGIAQDARQRKLFRRQLTEWFARQGRDLPWRRTQDPYAVLVSEMMCQQTQVATVLPYYARWMESFPEIRALAAASEHDVLRHWQGLGYYARARNLHRAARVVMEEHEGIFPLELESIRALPGVGDYTAGAVAAFAYNQPVPAVDANVARVIARLLNLQMPIDSAAGKRVVWETAASLVPEENARTFNSALMELGALVCGARTPSCKSCPVAEFCTAEKPERLPLKRSRPAVVRMEETSIFAVRGGKVLVEQCAGPKWKGLWMLPAASHGAKGRLLLSLEYPYTKHRVTLFVVEGDASVRASRNQRWCDPIDSLPMPSPHARAFQRLWHERVKRSS